MIYTKKTKWNSFFLSTYISNIITTKKTIGDLATKSE